MIGAIKRYKKRNKEMMATFGEFVYNFEFLCLSLKKAITEILRRNGLKNETLVEILVHDSTGAPLIKYFQASLQEAFKLQGKTDVEILKTLKTKLNDANELRNDLVHSGWVIGYGIEKGDKDLAIGIRSKVYAQGLSAVGHIYETEDFREASEHLETLEGIVRKIWKNIEKKRKVFNGVSLEKLNKIDLKIKKHD